MPGKILVPFLAGMLLALLSGWPLILFLRRLKARQFVSSDAPDRNSRRASGSLCRTAGHASRRSSGTFQS